MTSISIQPLGHASVLICTQDYNLLIDPVLMDKIGLSIGPWTIGNRRLTPPALRVHELPPIHAVLLSHAHFDHTDMRTLRQLPKDATALVQKGNRGLVRRFAQRHALRWGEEHILQHQGEPWVRVTSTPSKHWGARTLIDAWRGWGGYLLEFPKLQSPHWPEQSFSILFAGDTAQTDVFKELHTKRLQQGLQGIDLAIMPIGAYDPWIFNHCTPEQGWDMAIHDAGAHWFMPIHYETFSLSNEPFKEPITRLLTHAQAHDARQRVVGLDWSTPLVVETSTH